MDKKAEEVRHVYDRLNAHLGNNPDVEHTLSKIDEELIEVLDAIDSKDFVHLAEEVGDLLFNVLLLCSKLEMLPSTALSMTIRKLNNRSKLLELTNLSYEEVKKALKK